MSSSPPAGGSHPGAAPDPPPAGADGFDETEPLPPRRRRRGGTLLVAVAALAAVALVFSSVAWVVLATEGARVQVEPAPVVPGGPEPPGQAAGPAPEGWDEQLWPLAAFVAGVRGRPFLRPVEVRYLDDDAYTEAITRDGEPTHDDGDLAALTTQLHALGLLGGNVDVASQIDALVGGGTLAYYDSSTALVTVRGDGLDVARRVTLVHELTHAWQDQHFDLGRLEHLDDARAFTLRAVAEGDAVRVEQAYIAQLSSGELAEYQRRSREAAQAAAEQLTDVAEVLRASFTSPYAVGPPFVTILHGRGGDDEVDAALQHPPAADADLVDPRRWFEGVEPVDVPTPRPPDGQDILDEAELGALSWLMVLSARLDPREALDAVDGWAGDDTVTYRDGARACAVLAVRGVDATATDRWDAVLQDWADAGPEGSAMVQRRGSDVWLQTCADPDGAAPAGRPMTLALDYVAVRLMLTAQVLDQLPAGIEEASCFADHVVDDVPPQRMSSGQVTSGQEGRRRAARASAACLSG